MPEKKKTPQLQLDEIREFIRFFDKTGLTEIEVKAGDQSLYLSKQLAASAPYAVEPRAIAPVSAAPSPSAPVDVPVAPAQAAGKKLLEIKSPIVGTFYRAPSPTSAPFVNVGDAVASGKTVCIIEAMKIMNEIQAEISGVVREICVENQQPVEFGQVLFLVEPK
ncbi:MAG: acetyl-CoA carboxylase, biotin carboxyl carrier protein [Candidatus Raymondbacteria bacterium RifOxyC12_full_50_8]|uniref:Biotin carboxyl carrier protein of acetyl-CoA carboxylase n=1 Tax=Candidatus Raymondbacteria bacterium RIFOXYD12_FULL_49_13 TaxID=1817890 RepID=A0A1F7F718_UNCRA|nr:MAG: acetyl-CoA carboxylase, biotin carboxyl carrier protein [Candidatus Raymondbacteria bacterium RifOxyB12_full_50_8]OGJ93189.1 MAG: acetyl-CoA carboxylase, biotin carboxyl carrier protein [Candidatus Raymondbacteria bacterium RIFOXYA2_FULL_49_16]OGJ94641.1 MAG: acetyl-CoA carboxylase, biotin carboxyl carrier protein [Candidatus Raymondbacteria bacterium RifOxyC12_full_50_8]OGK02296.1 MAG: acetyl-CoA carboxylase, biotin carboxyl carrier protein [Candidatus Raymondbacteria bacterium RIFOXYD1